MTPTPQLSEYEQAFADVRAVMAQLDACIKRARELLVEADEIRAALGPVMITDENDEDR